jgi:superoxide reductase
MIFMTQINQIYKCSVCGNVVEVRHSGAGQLVCCGQPMEIQDENTVDASLEKHLPTIDRTDKGFVVKVGSIDHPMDEAHYIEWIELSADGCSYRRQLKPGQKPEAEFCLAADEVSARAYCNLHGLWRK